MTRVASAALLLALLPSCTAEPAPPDDASVPLDAAILPDGPLLDDASADEGEAFLATELLGRPTQSSVAVSLVPAADLEVFVEFAAAASPTYDRTTPPALHPKGEPFVLVLDRLPADAAVAYRVRWRRPGDPAFQAGPRRTAHTRRPPGQTFRFTVQSDSHLDENSDLGRYRRTLANALADQPDFHLDLGDTFMCEKKSAPLTPDNVPAPDAPTIDARYLYERGNFDLLAHSVPLFLVNGNHDGELGFLWKGGTADLAAWATLARHRFYLNPVPDSFYSGDAEVDPALGERASWYSWEWGDALFVALDPFWFTTKRSNSDGWVWTLGARQYQWLASTLRGSRAKYKFVFLHNLVGGLDGQMRGGVEAAPYFEWGGKNLDGTAGFAAQRPGWEMPIHPLLVETRVTAVFHGHDHVYVHQELDGIAYQEVPQPSARNTSSGPSLAASYHYAAGTIVSSSGHLRVTVSPAKTTVDYVRAWLPAEEGKQHNGQVADSWEALPR